MTNRDLPVSSQLQSSGSAALQKPGAAPGETHVRHRGDGGIRTGVISGKRRRLKEKEWIHFVFVLNIILHLLITGRRNHLSSIAPSPGGRRSCYSGLNHGDTRT